MYLAVTAAKFGTHMWDMSVAHTLSDDFLIVRILDPYRSIRMGIKQMIPGQLLLQLAHGPRLGARQNVILPHVSPDLRAPPLAPNLRLYRTVPKLGLLHGRDRCEHILPGPEPRADMAGGLPKRSLH